MDSDRWGTSESEPHDQRTTSNEWKAWLRTVENFTGAVDDPHDPHDIRPFVNVSIHGRQFSALADTGAVVNLIGTAVADHVTRAGVEPAKSKTRMRMADGSGVDAELSFELQGQIGGINHSWKASYVPNLAYDLILGMGCLLDLNLLQMRSGVFNMPPHDGAVVKQVNALDSLSLEEDQALSTFLGNEILTFDKVPGKTSLIEHRIKLKDGAVPIKQRHYPRNPAMQAILNEEVASMLRKGVIEPSDSPWSSPVVMVKKTNGKYRFCIDMRAVNDVSVTDAYPLPRINAILEKLRQAKYISTLDLENGYWQVPLSLDSRPITAFTVPGLGLFHFTRMPFGLHSAGATFQRLLDRVIGAELEPKVFAYLDDLIVVSKTFDEHLELLRLVFERLRSAGLKINPDKCHFCKREMKYLGHVVNYDGISTDPDKVKAIMEFPTPKSQKSLRSFLGMASWYRRFIHGFATVSSPLRALMKKGAAWHWTNKQESAFCKLKELLSASPVLACPDFSQPFTLQVDASNLGLGAALTQIVDGKEAVIGYASRALTDRERNYSTTEKECLALVWATERFKPYLEGYHFVAITDHIALSWLMKQREPSGRLARWIMKLQQYDFEIRYRKGVLNRVADALSRHPVECEPNTMGEASAISSLEVTSVTDVPVDETGIQEIPTTLSTNPDDVPIGLNGTDEVREDSSLLRGDWYTRMFRLVSNQPKRFRNYCIRQEKLYRKSRGKGDMQRSWRMCIRPEQTKDVLNEMHDQPTAGHLGVKKTTYRVGCLYYWPGWRQDVKSYVRSCSQCQEYKVAQMKPAGEMHFRQPKGPWVAISVDLVGPFPRSRFGHRYLLVVQDTFTKWIELAPIGTATAKNVSRKLKSIFLRFGSPETVISDNGTQFVSKMMQELAREWRVKLQTTAPYSPQSNPVERPNRVVKTMIAQFVKDNHRAWDANLEELQFAINTAEHSSTGFTPAKLCFGHELRPPRAICGPDFETSTSTGESTTEEVHDKREAEFKRIYETTHRNLKASFNRQAKYYNLRRRQVAYEMGDLVMRRLHVLSSAIDAVVGKLAPKYKGPCTILGRRGANIYEVQDPDTRDTQIVHVKDLKPYHSRDV